MLENETLVDSRLLRKKKDIAGIALFRNSLTFLILNKMKNRVINKFAMPNLAKL